MDTYWTRVQVQYKASLFNSTLNLFLFSAEITRPLWERILLDTFARPLGYILGRKWPGSPKMPKLERG